MCFHVPPFIKNESVLERECELTNSADQNDVAGFKNLLIKHVMAFLGFTSMILNTQHELLHLSLKEKDYTLINSEQMRCFVCGEHGHARQMCPHNRTAARPKQR